MQNSIKTILLIVGIILIGYGLYTVFTPDTVIDAGPIQLKTSDNSVDTQSAVVIGVGVLAVLIALFYKKK